VETWVIFASMIGWTLFPLGGAWGWIVSGLAVGVLQYLGLAHWKGAEWWIVANPVAWSIAGMIGVAAGSLLLSANPVLAWIFGWGVVGLAGAAMLLLPLSQLEERKSALHASN
jgi:hypothetical protein